MKINVKKLLSVGNILCMAATLLSLIALIIFNASVSMKGYFEGLGSSTVTTFAVLALVFGIISSVIPLISVNEKVDYVLDIVKSILVIVMTAFLVAAMIAFVQIRVDGLAKIFFSDANTIAETQTPENLASANTSITGIVFFAIAWVVSLVSSFFSYAGKEKEAAPAATEAE